MGIGMFLQVPNEWSEAVRLSKEWPRRTLKLQDQFVVMAAKYVLPEIMQRIPRGEDAERYKKALRVARVRSAMPAAAITVNLRARRVRKIDGPKTVLYVKRRAGVKRAPPEVDVLDRFSPWTVDTLPFQPKDKDAWVVSVKVSEREVAKVARDRKADKRKWRLELDKAGIREVKKDNGRRISPKVKAIPDVALIGFRLEFGFGGKAKPHWKPAIRNLLTNGVRKIARSRAMVSALTELRSRDWVRFPSKSGVMRSKISSRDASKFMAFQKRLGVRR